MKGLRIVTGAASLILGWALIVALVEPVAFLGDQDWPAPSVLLCFGLALLILINALSWWLRRWSALTYRRVLVGLLLVLFISQLVVALNWVDVSRADAFFVREQALRLSQGQTHWSAYFQIYPNNVNGTLLAGVALKLSALVTANPWRLLNVVRFAWMDTALLSSAYLLQRWHRARPGHFWLLLLWLTAVPLYAYGLYAYTDALVFPVVVNSLALLTRATQVPRRLRAWGLRLLALGLVALAVAVKSNMVVVWIALVLTFAVQRLLGNWSGRKTVGALLLSVATLGLVFSLMSAWQRQSGFKRNPDRQLPPTSWIAMSYDPRFAGEYDHTDFDTVNLQPTAKAKRQTANRLLKQHFQTLGWSGVMSHWAQKLRVFWSMGDFDSFRLTTQWIHAPQWYQVKQRTVQFWLVIMTQVLYATCLLFAIRVLWSQRRWRAATSYLALTILGLTAFHVLFWEVEPRYALPLWPGLVLLASRGAADWPRLRVPDRQAGLRVLASGLALVCLTELWQTSRTTGFTETRVALQENGDYVLPTSRRLAAGAHWRFTIKTSGPSDRLQLTPRTTAIDQPVTVTVRDKNRVLGRKLGPATQLQTIRYRPTTARRLRVTITNRGRRPVAYGAMVAHYAPQTGRVTAQAHAYPQYDVKWDHPTVTLSNGWVPVVVVGTVLAVSLMALAWTPKTKRS
ncbi:hypothetical protein [Lactiplantibacillus modestisalitolerans]|uniref:Integral membrane protein n=1 Tax=Lactiplantibacillus modestisalitolerans TaxID=1457219 RepID=A0ABV5WW51_9LACO|nr:hypothetical protein [Lactiplantibacillus modestisalitolerans]